MGRAEFDADAHAGEQQAGDDHPEGLHGRGWCDETGILGEAARFALQQTKPRGLYPQGFINQACR